MRLTFILFVGWIMFFCGCIDSFNAKADWIVRLPSEQTQHVIYYPDNKLNVNDQARVTIGYDSEYDFELSIYSLNCKQFLESFRYQIDQQNVISRVFEKGKKWAELDLGSWADKGFGYNIKILNETNPNLQKSDIEYVVLEFYFE